MADSVTAVYQFTLPEVGASDDTWGTKLNADFTKLDTLLTSYFADGTPTFLGNPQSPITNKGSSAVLRLWETDQTGPAGRYQLSVNSDQAVLQRAATGDFATLENILIIAGGSSPKKVTVATAYEFTCNSPASFANGVTISSGAISGSGSWITDIPASALPISPEERTRILANISGVGTGAVGTTALMFLDTGAAATGAIVSGANLFYASAGGSHGTFAPGGSWRCNGQISVRTTDAHATTQFLRQL